MIFSVTIISHFMHSTYSSDDLYPVGILAFENAVQISHILKKVFKKSDMEPRGNLKEEND